MKGIAAIRAGAGMHQQQISIQPIGLLRFVYNRLENLFAAPVILVGIEGVVCGTQGAGRMTNELQPQLVGPMGNLLIVPFVRR